MSNLLAARSQMAMSLAFHIIFASVGIAMPLMMTIAEWRWLRTGEEVYLALAKRWAKGTAILFAVGAVSGTVLSFELGLLWPAFMALAGSLIGPLFSLEGFAFFTEAIFLGIYLYGWHRVRPLAHLAAGGLVTISGMASALFVVLANGWMNTPTGLRVVHGKAVEIDPLAAAMNPAGGVESLHMILAAYAATGFAVAGIHAWLLLRDPNNLFHKRALSLAFAVGGIAAILQPLSGDSLAKVVARHQPAKLAALEGQFRTEPGAPFRIGGVPDLEAQRMHYALEIPRGLSLLLYWDSNAIVKGLDAFPREEWPPVGIVHGAFQGMVAIGFALAAVSLWGGWLHWRRGDLVQSRPFLQVLVVTAPLGFVAIEAGWVVTEVGRQPWIISGILRTSDAVTPMPGLVIPFVLFTTLYFFLAAVVVWLLARHVGASPRIVSANP